MKLSQTALVFLTHITLFLNSPLHAKLSSLNASTIHSQGVSDVFAGLKFHYLDQDDRLLIVNDFLKTVELEYSLLPLKAERIGLDFNKLKGDAIALEMNAENVMASSEERLNPDDRDRLSFLQAKSNMEFLDRMQVLVAQFKDTHFTIQEKMARPMVYTGLRFYRIGGKIIVGAIEKKFMAMAQTLSQVDYSGIAIGDEVVSINGSPVEKKIEELKKFIGGSSEEFIDSSAVRSLTMRNFNYEKSRFLTITFKNAGSFKLPLFLNKPLKSTPRLDTIVYLKKFDVPSDVSSIGMSFDKNTKNWSESSMAFEGYSPRKLHLNLKGVIEMFGEDGAPAIRSGYYMTNGKSYGVLQILTFSSSIVKMGETKMTFADGVRTFIAELKENKLPLILDLRVNGGGNGNLPSEVLSIIAPEKAIYPGETSGFRLTAYMRQIQDARLYQEIAGEDLSIGISMDEVREVLEKGIDEKREYTPMLASENIPYDFQKIKGFNNKIVALVTTECVSACDKMAFLLKSSKRAPIIGTQSNGTGAGYLSIGKLNTLWVDPLRVFESQVPNYVFGVPGASLEQMIFSDKSVEVMCSENQPTLADVLYAPTMLDVAKNNIGWLQKAAQVLEGMADLK